MHKIAGLPDSNDYLFLSLGPVSSLSDIVRGRRFSIQEHLGGEHVVGSDRPKYPRVHRLRSTQFDADHFTIDEAPEEHRRRDQPSLCETLKRLGYAHDNQVRLYGQVFDLVSDPVILSENFVFVDALERKSGQVRRVRIPPTIVQMARIKRRAA